MRIIEIEKLSAKRAGQTKYNNIKLEEHEINTLMLLNEFGYDIEVLRPMNTPNLNNPDIVMQGSIWEIKAPRSYNQKTLKERIRKASRQANKVIFDLRMIGQNRLEARDYLIQLFEGNSHMKRMIIIIDEEKILDIIKYNCYSMIRDRPCG